MGTSAILADVVVVGVALPSGAQTTVGGGATGDCDIAPAACPFQPTHAIGAAPGRAEEIAGPARRAAAPG